MTTTTRSKIVRKQAKMSVSKSEVKKDVKMSKKEKKLLKQLQKLMLSDAQTQKVKGFMYNPSSNILLGDNNPGQYEVIKGKISKRKLSKLGKKFNPAMVLVDCGLHNYHRLSLSNYKALVKIRYMILDIKIDITMDGEEEPYTAFEKEYRIASLNQLFNYLNKREGLIEGLNAYHTADGWYNWSEVSEKVKILYKSGAVKKMSLGEFVKKYKIYG